MSPTLRLSTRRWGAGIPKAWISALVVTLVCATGVARGQDLRVRYGTPVPHEVKRLFEAGLKYLADNQRDNGAFQNMSYGNGPGATGIALLAFLASGEDPNFGAYSEVIHKAVRFILLSQHGETGMFGSPSGSGFTGSMYEHGFATLAMAEAYGAVDDTMLWKGSGRSAPRSIGRALELGVGCLITSQEQNPYNAWRYSPKTQEQDTSVSGAALVALLAARNAGIEVPDDNIEKALKYFEQATLADGTVMYTLGMGGGMDSMARSSIATLVFAVGKKKDSDPFKAALSYVKDRSDMPTGGSWPWYTRYYMAQALFQGDTEAWRRWNDLNTEDLTDRASDNGCIGNDGYSTAMSLLSMAINYCFLPIYER